MHDTKTVQRVLDLAARGCTATQIAERVGLSRSTVRMWLSGALPRTARTGSDPCCPVCAGPSHDLPGLPRAYLYLLGLYLGDGCITAGPRGVYRLRVTLDARHPAIIEECVRAIGDLRPDRPVGRVRRSGGFENSRMGSSVDVSSYWRSWPCLLPQHGPGRKHERSIALTGWQQALVDRHPELLLRGLIHSDGCRFVNTGTNWRHPRYSFSNRSDDIRAIFGAACDRLGVRWTVAPHTVYVSRKDDVAILDRHIGPKA